MLQFGYYYYLKTIFSIDLFLKYVLTKVTEVRMSIDKITCVKLNSHSEILINNLTSIQKYLESDELFANEVIIKN
jgi:hypothetical protein